MAKGRKALSNKVKRAQGTLQTTRVNKNAPDLPVEIPMLDDDYPLTEVERSYYDMLAYTFYENQVVTRTDREKLAQGARVRAKIEQLRDAISATGELQVKYEDRDGNVSYKLASAQAERMLLAYEEKWGKWLADSGLTPATRDKVTKTVEKKKSGKRIELD